MAYRVDELRLALAEGTKQLEVTVAEQAALDRRKRARDTDDSTLVDGAEMKGRGVLIELRSARCTATKGQNVSQRDGLNFVQSRLLKGYGRVIEPLILADGAVIASVR